MECKKEGGDGDGGGGGGVERLGLQCTSLLAFSFPLFFFFSLTDHFPCRGIRGSGR